jgi:quercetin dioxygenase-like cupin family protein
MSPDLRILAQQADDGEPFWFLNALSIIKLSGKQTGGSFALIEDRLPAGRDTPYHLHQHEDETFHLLEGEMTFFSGSDKFTAGAGSTVFLPRGIPHGFRANTAGRVLILTTPSGFDDFVREVGTPATSLVIPEPQQPDVPKLVTVAAKYGIEILGPLPS